MSTTLDSDFVAEYDSIPEKEVKKEEELPEIELAKEEETKEIASEEKLDEISASETKARDDGWVPLDEFKGDPDDFTDHKEFNFRGQLMDRIKTQTKTQKASDKKLEKLESMMREMGEHNKKIADVEFKKAVASLKKEKAEAMDMSDHESVVEIDEQISDLKEAKKAAAEPAEEKKEDYKPTEQQNSVPEIDSWIADDTNSWYLQNTVMKGAADALFDQYAGKNFDEEPTPAEFKAALKHVDTKIKQAFPQEFSNPRRKESAVTESGSGRRVSGKKAKYSASDLTEDQLAVAKEFVDLGAIDSVGEYAKQLADIGEIESKG